MKIIELCLLTLSVFSLFLSCECVPPEWICFDEFYDANDGCDCDCGIFDPDCEDPNQMILNCDGGFNGTCLNPEGSCEYSSVPSAWTCPNEWYGSNDGCDCECGTLDLDCLSGTEEIYGCEGEGHVKNCTEDGECEYYDDIPDDWYCYVGFYNQGESDGCDCRCGAPDPDCDIPGIIVYGCDCVEQSCVDDICVGECEDEIVFVDDDSGTESLERKVSTMTAGIIVLTSLNLCCILCVCFSCVLLFSFGFCCLICAILLVTTQAFDWFRAVKRGKGSLNGSPGRKLSDKQVYLKELDEGDEEF